MFDLRGLEYFLFAGLGAIVGLVVSGFMSLVAFVVPTIWPYVFAPVVVFALAGLLWAAVMLK